MGIYLEKALQLEAGFGELWGWLGDGLGRLEAGLGRVWGGMPDKGFSNGIISLVLTPGLDLGNSQGNAGQ